MALVMTAALLASPQPAAATGDPDAAADGKGETICKGKRVFVDGRCVDPGELGCRVDGDCPGDLVCKAGRCVEVGAGGGGSRWAREDLEFALDKSGDARRRLGLSRAFTYAGFLGAAGGALLPMVTTILSVDMFIYKAGFYGAPIGIGTAWLLWGGFAVPAAWDGFARLDHGRARLDQERYRKPERKRLLGLHFLGWGVQAAGFGIFVLSIPLFVDYEDAMDNSSGRATANPAGALVAGLAGCGVMAAGFTISAVALFQAHKLLAEGIDKLDHTCNEAERQSCAPRAVRPQVAVAPLVVPDGREGQVTGLSLVGRW